MTGYSKLHKKITLNPLYTLFQPGFEFDLWSTMVYTLHQHCRGLKFPYFLQMISAVTVDNNFDLPSENWTKANTSLLPSPSKEEKLSRQLLSMNQNWPLGKANFKTTSANWPCHELVVKRCLSMLCLPVNFLRSLVDFKPLHHNPAKYVSNVNESKFKWQVFNYIVLKLLNISLIGNSCLLFARWMLNWGYFWFYSFIFAISKLD